MKTVTLVLVLIIGLAIMPFSFWLQLQLGTGYWIFIVGSLLGMGIGMVACIFLMIRIWQKLGLI